MKCAAYLWVTDLTKAGNPLEMDLLADNSSNPNEDIKNVNLDGYEADFTKGIQTHTSLRLKATITVTKIGSNPIKPIESVTYSASWSDLLFKSVIGYFGTEDYSNGADTLTISFFRNVRNGYFELADPKIKVRFISNIGLPIYADFTHFEGIDYYGDRMNLTGIPSPLPVPQLTMAEFGQTKMDSFEINGTNSNLSPYISHRPHNNVYSFDVETNPAGPVSRNWLLDTSKLIIEVEGELPFDGLARDYVFADTQALSLQLENLEQLEWIQFRL